MDQKLYQQIIENMLKVCMDALISKNDEYATKTDMLHNFRISATLQGLSIRKALSGMMSKHTVSVYDMINNSKSYDMKLWEEKIKDSINYLLILRCVLEEERILKEEIRPSITKPTDTKRHSGRYPWGEEPANNLKFNKGIVNDEFIEKEKHEDKTDTLLVELKMNTDELKDALKRTGELVTSTALKNTIESANELRIVKKHPFTERDGACERRFESNKKFRARVELNKCDANCFYCDLEECKDPIIEPQKSSLDELKMKTVESNEKFRAAVYDMRISTEQTLENAGKMFKNEASERFKEHNVDEKSCSIRCKDCKEECRYRVELYSN